MKVVRVSPVPVAYDDLVEQFEWLIERWGLDPTGEYRRELLSTIRAVALGEPVPAGAAEGRLGRDRDGWDLKFCEYGEHRILFRESEQRIEVAAVFAIRDKFGWLAERTNVDTPIRRERCGS